MKMTSLVRGLACGLAVAGVDTLCRAAAPAATRPAAVADAGLAAHVAALPAASAEERVKKATLAWALEDADAEDAAGRAAFATRVRGDVAHAIAQPIGRRGESPSNLFPAIPSPASNPYAIEALKRATKTAASDERFPKGPAGAITTDKRGWYFPTITGEALAMCRALCHPQSAMADDPRLVAPMLRRFATVYEYLAPGSKQLADFGDSSQLAEMYLLLRTARPGLILPAYREAWERAIGANSDAILAKYGQTFREAKPGSAYPNAHVRYLAALVFGGLVLDRADCKTAADGALRLLDSALYPDGAFCYIGLQNEALTYHGISVESLARVAQVTGDPLPADMVKRTRWYYPLSVEPPGVAEYSTAPSWKPYWNQINGGEFASIVAAATRDAQNARIASENFSAPDLNYATFYRPDLKPAAAPDGYVVYDRNVEGGRGRFGTFSFSSTARDYGDEDERGKSTFVGCMVLDSSEPKPDKWPLNAALQDAGCEVRVKPGEGGIDRSKTHLSLASHETNASAASESFATVSTSYRLSAYSTKAADWAGRQLWLLTPQRLVGLVQIESLKDQQALGVDGSLKLVSGRSGWGTRKEFKTLSKDSVEYGKLIVTFRAHDFARLETEYTDTFGGDAKKSGRVLLLDAAKGDAPVPYQAGAHHFYLVEVRPESSPAAAGVRVVEAPQGLMAFEVREAEHRYRLLYNPTGQDVAVDQPIDWPAGRLALHTSGEQYRPAWISDDGKPSTTRPSVPLTVEHGTVHIIVPANGHVTISDLP